MISSVYEDFLMTKWVSVFGADDKDWVKVPMDKVPTHIPLMKAFIEDDDIQEIQITSANIGFVRTWQKVFKKKEVVQ